MPPKTSTKKVFKKVNVSDSDSESVSSVSSVDKPKVVEKKKTDKSTKVQAKAGPEKSSWREVSEDEASDAKHSVSPTGDESGEDVYAVEDVDETQQKGKRNSSSFLNFAYKDYMDVSKPCNDVSTVDLLRTCIARAAAEGQHQLCRSLRDTLKALNFEGDFPRCPPPYRPQSSSRGGFSSGPRRAPFTRSPTDAPPSRSVHTEPTFSRGQSYQSYRGEPQHDQRFSRDPRMMREQERPAFRGQSFRGRRGAHEYPEE